MYGLTSHKLHLSEVHVHIPMLRQVVSIGVIEVVAVYPFILSNQFKLGAEMSGPAVGGCLQFGAIRTLLVRTEKQSLRVFFFKFVKYNCILDCKQTNEKTKQTHTQTAVP